MANLFKSLQLLCLLFSLLTSLSHAQSCTSGNFPNNQIFSSCYDLPVLDSSIHWNYDPSSQLVQLAYRKTGVAPSTWISWAINPTTRGMVGSQALVAFQGTDGSMTVYTSPITSYQTQLQQGSLSFPVFDLSAMQENCDMIIFATIQLPGNTTMVNHVWQEGPVYGNVPGIHALSGANMQSFGSIDFLSRKTAATRGSGKSWDMKTVSDSIYLLWLTVA